MDKMMRISEAQKKLDEFVEKFVNEWRNGSRNDNIRELKRMNPYAAAYVCLLTAERIGDHDSAILIRRLQTEGLEEMVTNNW